MKKLTVGLIAAMYMCGGATNARAAMHHVTWVIKITILKCTARNTSSYKLGDTIKLSYSYDDTDILTTLPDPYGVLYKSNFDEIPLQLTKFDGNWGEPSSEIRHQAYGQGHGSLSWYVYYPPPDNYTQNFVMHSAEEVGQLLAAYHDKNNFEAFIGFELISYVNSTDESNNPSKMPLNIPSTYLLLL